MKIVRLTAENFKRLRAVEIAPDGRSVVLRGKNEQGKSSVLDAIWCALGGEKVAPKKPIRDGEERASIVLELPDYKVTRTWTANDKTYLKVESLDGARYPSPQKILDRLVGDLTFDPLAFAHMDARKQREVLLGIVDIDLDLVEWEAEHKRIEERRRDLNRAVKEREALVKGLPEIPEDTPDTETPIQSVVEELEVAEAHNREVKAQRDELEILFMRESRLDTDIERLTEKIKALEEERDTLANARTANQSAQKKQRKVIEKLEPMDTAPIRERMSALDGINAAVRDKRHAEQTRAALDSAVSAAKLADDELQQHRKAKADALTAAIFPVAGLSVSDDGVVFGDIPFDQLSKSAQLKVSLAVAMALNPTLRVIRIENGAWLDSDNLQVIQDMATEQDYQLWIERVEGDVGLLIEDGQVVEPEAQGVVA